MFGFGALNWLKGGFFYSNPIGIDTVGHIGVQQVGAVMTCVRILADNVSKLPVYVRQEGEKLKDHSAYNLLYYSPNGWQNAQTFFSTLETNRNLFGNAFARIHRDGNGFAKRLEFVKNTRVSSWRMKEGRLFYTVDGKEIRSEDILHFKHFSLDGVTGLNPVEMTKIYWETSGKAGLATKKLYDQGMLSTLALKSSVAGANLKQMQDASKKFEESQGALNAGKVVPLPPNTELQSIPISLKDLQFLETIKANANFIAAMFGVPAHMVTGDAPKYANFEQSMLDFKTNTMSGILSMYEYELELKLLTEEERKEGVSIEFDDKSLNATDAQSRAQIDKIHLELGVITPNDIARKEGYKTYPEGDRHYIASNNLTPVDSLSEDQAKEMLKMITEHYTLSKKRGKKENI